MPDLPLTTLRPWLPTLGLVLLGLTPAAYGVVLLASLTFLPQLPLPEQRYHTHALALVTHVIGGIGFWSCGLLHLGTALQKPLGHWRKRLGRLALPFGVITGLSGIWLALVFPQAPDHSAASTALRLAAGGLLLFGLGHGTYALLKRDFASHRRWMLRAYAWGLATGTQALLFGLAARVFDLAATGHTKAALLAIGLAINIIVAERLLRPRRRGTARLSRQRI